jgi:hypothetical protein
MNNHYTFPPSNPYETRYEKNYQQIEQDVAAIQDVTNTIRPEHIILGMIALALVVWLIWPKGGSQGVSVASGAQVTGLSVAEMTEMLKG